MADKEKVANLVKEQFAQKKILVLGDLMVDEYIPER